MKKWYVSDAPAYELSIWLEDTDDEADGEFIFNSLKEAKKYCLSRIDYDMKQLTRARKNIEEHED